VGAGKCSEEGTEQGVHGDKKTTTLILVKLREKAVNRFICGEILFRVKKGSPIKGLWMRGRKRISRGRERRGPVSSMKGEG